MRTGSVGNTGTIDSTYNAADQLTETDDGTNTTTYTYDDNGNQATSGGRSFSYDLAGQLASTTASSITTTYGYDGDGRRVSSSVGGGTDLRHVWDPLAESGLPELALERETDGDLVRRYIGGPLGPVSMENPSETFFYHSDPLGTVTDLTDESGDPQWRYSYEAYGAALSATNVSGTAPENRLRFNGQYLDPETSQYHLRARQYDPATGQFGALDPLENPLASAYGSAYVYVDGRPTVLVDPLGLYGWKDFKKDATGGAKAIGGAVGVIGDYRSHIEFWQDQAQRGVERGGVAGFAQYFAAGGAEWMLSPFAEIQSGTETLWDPCASGWDKMKAAGSIVFGIASLTPPGRAVRAGAAARVASSGGRVKRVRPDPRALGPHTAFKRDPATGRVTGYTTYDERGRAVKRFRGTGRPGHGGIGPPVIYEPKPGKIGGQPKVPRPPEPWELPNGY